MQVTSKLLEIASFDKYTSTYPILSSFLVYSRAALGSKCTQNATVTVAERDLASNWIILAAFSLHFHYALTTFAHTKPLRERNSWRSACIAGSLIGPISALAYTRK